MATKKERQRELARQAYERRMDRQAQRAKRTRQLWASAIAVVLVLGVGTGVAAAAGLAVGAGGQVARFQNENGVVLELVGAQLGLAVSLGSAGMRMSI